MFFRESSSVLSFQSYTNACIQMILEKRRKIKKKKKKILNLRNPAFMYCRMTLGGSQPYAYMFKISSLHHSLVQ